jgi:hypothetical protein
MTDLAEAIHDWARDFYRAISGLTSGTPNLNFPAWAKTRPRPSARRSDRPTVA